MDTEYIKEVIEKDIERLGCKVWGLELFGRHSNQTLRIFIDNKDGISVEDCEKVSKHVSKVLDTENDFSEKYMLEISSPGLDRKFFYKEQYQEFINESIRVTFFDNDNKKTIKGNLKEVDDISIKLEIKEEIHEIPFSSIIQANLLI
ncbi:MAG: ribosome maturation factor RimP [SAR86 cluster bacterium]|jgi:ribosome maturation factor RimP|nr:ribosome maturation factor RimP [SAR86 cluster bacterium]MDG1681155.1 ribosome maturation factor RimP [SAR86 cluster bacterium]|tara:strand:- start:28 stop:468 length:441 start_codon:yes stop_codon:yes gene_type:complete